jgi:hypothetical protein
MGSAIRNSHDWAHRLRGRRFRLSVERLEATHYAGTAI